MWYGRAALRGHVLAALCAGEMLTQSGGKLARSPGVNFEMLGANQARRIASAGGAVSVRREGWKLGYYVAGGGGKAQHSGGGGEAHHSFHDDFEDPFERAKGFFEVRGRSSRSAAAERARAWDESVNPFVRLLSCALSAHASLASAICALCPIFFFSQAVLDLTGAVPPVDRDCLQWEKSSLSRATTAAPASGTRPPSRDAALTALSSTSPITGGGGPPDWPGYRCRAYLGLAMLAQEGLGYPGPPSMSRAARLLTEALVTVHDARALALLNVPRAPARQTSTSPAAPTLPRIPQASTSRNHVAPQPTAHEPGDLTPAEQGFSRLGLGGGGNFAQGSSVVVFNLALCYHFGRGVPQDMAVARRLYSEFLRRGGRDVTRDGPADGTSGRVPGYPPDTRTTGLGLTAASAGGEGAAGAGDPYDPVANHKEWGDLAESLRAHCDGLATKQRHFIARAAAILEG